MVEKVLRRVFVIWPFNFFGLYIRVFKPTPFHNRFKAFFLRIMGAQVGSNLVVYQGVWIDHPKGLTIGSNGDLSKDVIITTGGRVSIGNDVLIGYGAKILSSNHIIPKDRSMLLRLSGHKRKPIIIQDNVWICANCVILPGIKIGTGSVVAAGAVVTKDIPPYSVYGGVPAKLLWERD